MTGIRGQLALVGCVFAMGGLGGAGLLHVITAPDRADEKGRTTKNADDSTELAELRNRLDQLGVPTSPATGSHEVAARVQKVPSDGEPGVLLSDVLSRLENQYQANLDRAEREHVARTSEVEARAAVEAAPSTPSPAEAAPLPEQPAPRTASEAAPAAQRVAVLEVSDAEQVNVNPGTVNVTNVTDQSSDVSVIAQYPYYPFVYVPSHVDYRGVANQGVYPNRPGYPPPNVAARPVDARAQGKRYDSFKPPPGPDSPMFPAHASASLGPIFGGLP